MGKILERDGFKLRKTSIIILTFNQLEYTKACLESIWKYTEKGSYEIVVVDNGSTDGTLEWLSEQQGLKLVVNSLNLGFPKGCNRGLEVIDADTDILFLNNDTIVTENWLVNLKICLDSDPKIGAVGAVSNHHENLQGVSFQYENMEEMQSLARENNHSSSSMWEDKIFLIGFCLLVRREVMMKIGKLDENYSPGYIEDNDLSLQIVKLGYRLVLCHDVFIHHYLGTGFRKDLDQFYQLLSKNRDYFFKKWGFSTFCFDEVKEGDIQVFLNLPKVLEWQAGIGVTGLRLSYLFPNMIIHGIEENTAKRAISARVMPVFSCLEEVVDRDYDVLLIDNLLEKVDDPKAFLLRVSKYLKKDGYIIGNIENMASFSNIWCLLKNEWYFETLPKRNHFTIMDIQQLFHQLGFKNDYIYSWYRRFDEEEEKVVKKLSEIVFRDYQFVGYSFRFQKKFL